MSNARADQLADAAIRLAEAAGRPTAPTTLGGMAPPDQGPDMVQRRAVKTIDELLAHARAALPGRSRQCGHRGQPAPTL